MSENNLTVGRIGDLSPRGDQADGLRILVKKSLVANGSAYVGIPDFRVKVGIRDGRVVEVDYLDSLTSGALSTPPTVDQVKQWLSDAVKFLEGGK